MLGEPHSRDGRSEKEKNFCPYRDLNPVPVQAMASRYIDYDTWFLSDTEF
jgi:hypothetical protein